MFWDKKRSPGEPGEKEMVLVMMKNEASNYLENIDFMQFALV